MQLYPGSLVSMFDDHCCQITGGGTYVSPTGLSRGLVLKLDTTKHTATMVSQFTRADGFDADYMGSLQPQGNGDEFIGWGSVPSFSEYSADGKLLQQARLPGPDLSYRATIEPWEGLPADPPDGAARAQGSKHDRLRELERGHAPVVLAGAGRCGRGSAAHRRLSGQAGL